ncbi:hypothetical protein Pcinc_012742 [Petrolisthes cinctipes]|uniref:PiggyBac transposable element-derived protein domain-containing protein n=1 Tax=Petrolisthes cinctipes TaxID=88211 RepID=A0AAE1G400_PETCI|nr:hypothetical protein Pcinc_012742 [Petrolisthes cinctipes]
MPQPPQSEVKYNGQEKSPQISYIKAALQTTRVLMVFAQRRRTSPVSGLTNSSRLPLRRNQLEADGNNTHGKPVDSSPFLVIMDELTEFDITAFYTRERTRQLCRANEGIIPVQQDNGVSDESSDEDEELEDTILPDCHTAELGEGSQPIHTAKRYDRTVKKVVEIPQPNIVKLYNTNMGGVDLADCLLSLYRIPVRSKKYYHRLIFHMIDMAINQAWLLYQRDYETKRIPQEKRHPLLSFRMAVSESLIRTGKIVKRGRPSSNEKTADPPKKRRQQMSQVRPLMDIRLDKVGHFPEVKNPRLYCKRLGCKGRTNIRCIKCNVNLCLNEKNNCFLQFHN